MNQSLINNNIIDFILDFKYQNTNQGLTNMLASVNKFISYVYVIMEHINEIILFKWIVKYNRQF